jgi:hypothetical protein
MIPEEALAKLAPHRTHESNWFKTLLCRFGLHRWYYPDFGALMPAQRVGIEKEDVLPDVHPRAPAAAGEKGSQRSPLDERKEIGKAGAGGGSALRLCTRGAQTWTWDSLGRPAVPNKSWG